ncbi:MULTISPECIES: polysaccharide deacetylase family protein [unclassified Acidovorax]|uniref:polysaccharide deacetylase family protein n=1 Tax=unclassified Acidovorax TaxID=2684926 RepID=UPI000B405F8A|nr:MULTISPECIES: polysaccharide deacetylase family protein [unclassified Acidovorax]MBP3981842.1 polysaccharide deacetylase family protein [Acidovorax sp. JG5]MBU4422570.1 polysaccharide deacetylase family protein [Gammaproteobacteria bacterium]
MSLSRAIKDVIRTTLYRSGALGAWHRRRNKHALTVLMFHRVLPAGSDALAQSEREFAFSLDGFQETLDFVSRHYNVVDLAQVKAVIDGRGRLPDCPLLITFDDGWRDTVEYAMPELKKRSLPGVLFLATEVIDLDQPRWWQDAAGAILADPATAPKLLTALGMSEDAMTQPGFSQHVAAKLAGMPEVERRHVIHEVDPRVLEKIDERQMMNVEDLSRWTENGFELGGHGHTHSPIAYANDPEAEVSECRDRLRALGLDVLSLSYPHGVKSDASRELLKNARFDLVFDSNPCLANVSSLQRLRFDLPRIHLPENTWTTRNGRIDPARLALYLFPRSVI